jgi:hypothetical protein
VLVAVLLLLLLLLLSLIIMHAGAASAAPRARADTNIGTDDRSQFDLVSSLSTTHHPPPTAHRTQLSLGAELSSPRHPYRPARLDWLHPTPLRCSSKQCPVGWPECAPSLTSCTRRVSECSSHTTRGTSARVAAAPVSVILSRAPFHEQRWAA